MSIGGLGVANSCSRSIQQRIIVRQQQLILPLRQQQGIALHMVDLRMHQFVSISLSFLAILR